MTNEIIRHENPLRTWDNKPVRCSQPQLVQALAPMFATFPGVEMSDETFNAYYMMLCDLEPNQLARAVLLACQAHEYPTQLVTVAAIRKAYDSERRAPGPHSDVDVASLPKIPSKMFRLPADEDRRERLERLRKTQDWQRYYG